MPTGGVYPTKESLSSWLNAGATCVGLGSQLISKDILDNKDFDGLTAKVKQVLDIIKDIRK
ncbi:keto-hydroxyglutarate-aldolase/keto-deoxy-phosphogluconate aldolase [compost metagenome]